MQTTADEDLARVRRALRDYLDTWNSGQVSGLKEFWDAGHAEPVYVAEEKDVMQGWPEIEAYWAALNGLNVAITTGEAHLSRLAPDVVLASYPMHWSIRFESHPHWDRPIGGRVRVSAVFARRGPDWKIVHYIEAPYAPAVQVKKWLERDAKPG
jgi:ketosteroid isomerase-like protein